MYVCVDGWMGGYIDAPLSHYIHIIHHSMVEVFIKRLKDPVSIHVVLVNFENQGTSLVKET